MHRRRYTAPSLCLALVALVALAAAPYATAQSAPQGEPVKWDQARMTQYAVDLQDAISDAVQQMRKSPIQTTVSQRQTWYDLKEDLRLLANTSGHLRSELQNGASAEETRATFDRIDSLRRNAEEHGRKSMIPDPVMADLTRAGAIHNQMRPYYYGKR